MPQLQPYWAAGFSFSRGHFVYRVPYDGYLPMVFQVLLRAFFMDIESSVICLSLHARVKRLTLRYEALLMVMISMLNEILLYFMNTLLTHRDEEEFICSGQCLLDLTSYLLYQENTVFVGKTLRIMRKLVIDQ